MRSLGLWVAILVAAVLTVTAAPAEDANTPELAAKAADAAKDLPAILENTRPLLFIPMLDAPKALTGDLKDPIWEKAAQFKLVSYEKGEIVPAKFATVAHLFCTAEALYVGVRCEDSDPANVVVNNAAAWQNDSIEFFIYPGESCAGGKLYYQLCIDAAKKLEPYHTHIYPKHQYRTARDEWKPDVACELAKDDKGWSIEFKLKFSDLILPEDAKAKKALWRMDLFRNRKARGGDPDQSYAWIPTDASGHYHMPSRFGFVLPAPYTTPELIADVIARAAAANKPAVPPSADALHQIGEMISRLGHDDYNIRDDATRRLAALAEEKRPLVPAIKTLLEKTLTDTDDSEVKLRAIKVLRTCYALVNPDDDIPPENMGN